MAQSLDALTILIVDDQRPFQLMLKGILTGLGAVHMHFATSGEQALSRAMLHSYDLLFVDYNLGAGRNGRQLLEDLRHNQLLHAQSIFILVTGENTLPMVMGAVELEPDDYLIKPFSQQVLSRRLSKIQQKKQQLAELYQAMTEQNSHDIIAACRNHIAQHGLYSQFCRRVLVEHLLHIEQFDAAEHELAQMLEQRQTGWALILAAKMHEQQGHYEQAVSFCDDVINLNKRATEAYDIKARCQLKLTQYDAAVSTVQQGLTISPFQLERQFLMLEAAQHAGMWQERLNASKQIYEQTRRTSRQENRHLLNYIRCLIEATANTDDNARRNRLQQDTFIALQRACRDDSFSKAVDVDIFEKICMARMDSIEGRLNAAQRALGKILPNLKSGSAELPDAAMLCLQIGEFEEGAQLLAQLTDEQKNDNQLTSILRQQQKQCNAVEAQFSDLNRAGIRAYREERYLDAYRLFEQTLQLAPYNCSAALNRIQAALQLLALESKPANKKQLPAAYNYCQHAFGYVKQLQLAEKYQQRFQDLLIQYKERCLQLGLTSTV